MTKAMAPVWRPLQRPGQRVGPVALLPCRAEDLAVDLGPDRLGRVTVEHPGHGGHVHADRLGDVDQARPPGRAARAVPGICSAARGAIGRHPIGRHPVGRLPVGRQPVGRAGRGRVRDRGRVRLGGVRLGHLPRVPHVSSDNSPP